MEDYRQYGYYELSEPGNQYDAGKVKTDTNKNNKTQHCQYDDYPVSKETGQYGMY